MIFRRGPSNNWRGAGPHACGPSPESIWTRKKLGRSSRGSLRPLASWFFRPRPVFAQVCVTACYRKRNFQRHVRWSALECARVRWSWAQFGHNQGLYSITYSALASSDGVIVSPSALAVLRLITTSHFVGCSTGEVGRLAVFGDPVHVVRSAGHSNALLSVAIARPSDPEVMDHRRTVLEP